MLEIPEVVQTCREDSRLSAAAEARGRRRFVYSRQRAQVVVEAHEREERRKVSREK